MEIELNAKQKKKYLNQVYKLTNPIKPHEAEIISSILRIHTGEHFWRFQKHVFCGGCRRELTVLDYFLTGLQHHDVEFILKQVCPDYEEHGTCDHEADAINVDKIEVVDHAMPVMCTQCGFLNNGDYKLYVHPGCKGYMIRLPNAMHEGIIRNL